MKLIKEKEVEVNPFSSQDRQPGVERLMKRTNQIRQKSAEQRKIREELQKFNETQELLHSHFEVPAEKLENAEETP